MRRLAACLSILAICAPLAISQPSPTGRLEASGRGTVVIQGQIVTFGLLSEPSRLVVVDFDGDARVFVDGKAQTLYARPGAPRAPHRVTLSAAKGRYLVTGTSVRVRVKSRRMTMSLAGVARIDLTGRGTYQVDDGDVHDWGDEGRIGIGPSEESPEGENR
jgi:hypothetical protein